MFSICLIFSGIAMFLNGFLPLVEENDNNEIVVMNVLSGIVVTILSIFGIIYATETINYLLYGITLAFGFTNLYIAGICIWDLSEGSFGWFCAFITLTTLVLGIYLLLTGEMTLGIALLVWMFLWAFYFVSRSLNVLQKPSSWVIMFEGAIAMVCVGILILMGVLML